MKKRKYWCLIEVFECPVCGRSKVYKTRHYGPKPKKWSDTHKWTPDYDWCLDRPY